MIVRNGVASGPERGCRKQTLPQIAGNRTLSTSEEGGLRNGGYPLLKSGMCFSTHVMNETASPLSDLPSGVSS
jgi:hypothetical protein